MKSESLKRVVLILISFTVLQGCQKNSMGDFHETKRGHLHGKIRPSHGAVILAQTEANVIEIPTSPDGYFEAFLNPGNYKILMKSSDGSLTLIKKEVIIEDNISISLLNVSMVPIPRITSVSVPIVTKDSATIEWETDIDSEGRIEYGTDANYGYSTFSDTDLKKIHRLQIFSLLPSTPYHFRVSATRHGLDSVQSFSRDYTFATDE
ncbi:fibronectin type III domain-containing protein [bacterium]|nr:fibronectin type III domain-containing protein [bacterium]